MRQSETACVPCLLCTSSVAGIEDFVGQLLAGRSSRVSPSKDPHAKGLAQPRRALRDIAEADKAHGLSMELIHDELVPGLCGAISLQPRDLLIEVQHRRQVVLGQGSRERPLGVGQRDVRTTRQGVEHRNQRVHPCSKAVDPSQLCHVRPEISDDGRVSGSKHC